MGLVGPYDIGTEFTRQPLPESQKVWLAHAKAREGLIKACGLEGTWRGPYGSYNYTSRRSSKESHSGIELSHRA